MYIYLSYLNLAAQSLTHSEHGVYLPDSVPHLVDDRLQVSVFHCQLLDQLLMLLVGYPIGLACKTNTIEHVLTSNCQHEENVTHVFVHQELKMHLLAQVAHPNFPSKEMHKTKF